MKTKIKVNKNNFFTSNIVYVLLLGLMLRLFLSFFGTLQLDQGTFIAWSNNLIRDGLKSFYNGWSDYLPGYLYILWGLGKINLLNIIPQVVLYKLPAIFSDVITGYLIYKILSKKEGEWLGIVGSLVYMLNPAVFANSALWGQVDSLTALAVILSIYLIDKNYFLSAIVLSIGTLIKPQAAFVFPLIIFLFIKEKRKIRDFLIYCFSGLVVFILGFTPFSKGNVFQFVIERLKLSANQYPYTSVNAFNFWGFWGTWKPDNTFFQIGGYIFVAALLIILFIKYVKKNIPIFTLASFIFASSFMFFTRIHERHLLPALAPLTIAVFENPIMLIPYIGFSVIYILNLIFSHQWIANNFVEIYPDIFIKFIEVTGLTLVIFMFIIIFRDKKIKWKRVKDWVSSIYSKFKANGINNVSVDLPKSSLSKKKSHMILLGILLFALVTRIYRLWSPANMYFDEVYHAFTAKVILHGGAEAWEWWNTPPEGFAYEWTHPPLAKLGMALGMRIFGVKTSKVEEKNTIKFNYIVLNGDNLWNIAKKTYGDGLRFTDIAKMNNLGDPGKIYPNQILILEKTEKYIKTEKIFPGENSFGWRIPGALLGVGSVFLVYLIAKKLFNDELVGLLSAGVFSLDGLPLVSSRIGMNDTYFLFFALLSIYFFMKEKDLLSAIAWGLSISSKWSALWAVPVIFVLWLKRKNKIKLSILWFLLVPPIIYLLSYLPMFTTGHDLTIWWGMQKQMWWYHTGLVATHAYSSPWWSWPFLVRPVYLYTSDEIGGFVSRIYMMGNPFVFWIGFASVLMCAIYAYLERDKKVGFVVFSYLIFFAPWAVSPRIMFMYHYLPSIPFLAMAVGYVLRRNPKYVFGLFTMCLVTFIYFYPHWVGLNIPLWLDRSYYWISTWR